MPSTRPISLDRKSTRLNSSHPSISYAVFCLKKKNPMEEPATSNYVNSIHRLAWTPPAAKHFGATAAACTCGLRNGSDRLVFLFFFFNDTATTEIYPLSLPDALPI